MSRSRIPALHLIVGFEAAARLRSFKDAAHELALTPSAVSQRVRKLEIHLGIRLFERVVRGVELTPDGERYLGEVQKAMRDLDAAGERLSCASSVRLTLAMNAIVAHEMVIPNLPSLPQGRGVDLALEITTRQSMKTFTPGDADAGIRIGTGAWEGFEVRPIGGLSTVPMSAPHLAAKVRDWDDFFDHTLYCAKSRRAETLESLRHPATGRCHPNVVDFQTLPEAIRAAESGLGFIGGLVPLMNNFMAQGRLRPAFEAERPLDERVLFISRPGHPHAARLDRIHDWLVANYQRLSGANGRAGEKSGGAYLTR